MPKKSAVAADETKDKTPALRVKRTHDDLDKFMDEFANDEDDLTLDFINGGDVRRRRHIDDTRNLPIKPKDNKSSDNRPSNSKSSSNNNNTLPSTTTVASLETPKATISTPSSTVVPFRQLTDAEVILQRNALLEQENKKKRMAVWNTFLRDIGSQIRTNETTPPTTTTTR